MNCQLFSAQRSAVRSLPRILFGAERLSLLLVLSLLSTAVNAQTSVNDINTLGYSAPVEGEGMGLIAYSSGNLVTQASFPAGTKIGGWTFRADSTVLHHTGDFDGDGRDDLIVWSPAGIALLSSLPNTRYAQPRSWKLLAAVANEAKAGGWSIATYKQIIHGVGDFNNDGRDDILITGSDAIGLLTLGSDGLLTTLTVHDNGTRLGGWVIDTKVNKLEGIGDFDGNNRADVLITSGWGIGVLTLGSKGMTSVMLQPNGTRFGGWNYDSKVNPIQGIGDFDGNGRDDFVLTSGWGIGVLTLNGTTFNSLMLQPNGTRFGGWNYSSGGNPIQGIGDLDGNGRDDIVLTSGWGIGVLTLAGTTFNSLMLKPNGTRFGGWNYTSTGNPIQGIGDFDGNGRDDIVITSGWGIGILTLAGDTFNALTLKPNGTSVGAWTLAKTDRVVLAKASNASVSSLVLQRSQPVSYTATEVDSTATATATGSTVIATEVVVSYAASEDGHVIAASSLAAAVAPPAAGLITTPLAGGGGGTRYDLACGNKQVLVGLEGNSGSWIDRVGLICMTVNESGEWASARVDDTVASPYTVGAKPVNDNSRFSTLCLRNHAVTGISGFVGSYVNGLRLHCQRLTSPTTTSGTQTSTTFVGTQGGFGSGPFGRFDCADSRAATGLYGRAGSYVDSIGLKCIDESHWRPSFHFSPRRGWMNDPAGLVQANGTYHLYYQATPGSTSFNADNVEWGHAESADLIAWTEYASVFRPIKDGLDNYSPFTGSGIVTNPQGGLANGSCECASGITDRCIVAMFTRHKSAPVFQFSQRQVLATSCDRGRTFGAERTIVESAEAQPHFRDPKVFLYQDPTDASRKYWVMAIAAGDLVRMYRSGTLSMPTMDLKNWTALPSISIFGEKNLNGPFTETPDLIKLQTPDGQSSRWVLTFAKGYIPPPTPEPIGVKKPSEGYYVVGCFNGTRFWPETPDCNLTSQASPPLIQIAKRLDGPDFYAPQTWYIEPPLIMPTKSTKRISKINTTIPTIAPTRRIMGGWLNNWLYAYLMPTSQWRGQLAIPRELSLARLNNGTHVLRQMPVREIETHRRPRPVEWSWRDVVLEGRRSPVPAWSSIAYEADMVIDMRGNPAPTELRVEIRHGSGPGKAVVGWRRIGSGDDGQLYLNRSSAYSGGGPAPEGFASPQGSARDFAAPLRLEDGLLRLRLFVDHSSVEAFGGDGRTVLSGLFFPHPGNRQLNLEVLGGKAKVVRLDLIPLE